MSNQVFEVREKLAALEEQLQAVQPNIASNLRDIHRILKQDPEVVTLLSEAECSILVRGLKKQTATTIATTAKKKTTKGTPKIKKAEIKK